MSIGYTEHELRGMFTEEEIAYGVPYIIYGDYNPDLEYSSEETVEPDSEEIDNMVNEIVAQLYETIKTNSVNIKDLINAYNKIRKIQQKKLIGNDFPIDLDKKISAIKKLKGVSDKDEIYFIIHKMNVLHDMENILNRYFLKEKIPKNYYYLIQKKGALNILLQKLLTSIIKNLSASILYEIEILSDQIYTNELLKTPYNRVGIIRNFVHNIVDKELGYDYSKKLNPESMRIFLSTCRVHLNYYDFRFRDFFYFNKIEEKCLRESFSFRNQLGSEKSKDNKNNYLKGIYLMPISYYQSIKNREHNDFIEFVSKLKDLDINIYKNTMIESYSIKYREEYRNCY